MHSEHPETGPAEEFGDQEPTPAPFTVQRDRERFHHEHEQRGTRPSKHHQDQDWIGSAHQGGGHVPADYAWTSNPKQEQDDQSAG